MEKDIIKLRKIEKCSILNADLRDLLRDVHCESLRRSIYQIHLTSSFFRASFILEHLMKCRAYIGRQNVQLF